MFPLSVTKRGKFRMSLLEDSKRDKLSVSQENITKRDRELCPILSVTKDTN